MNWLDIVLVILIGISVITAFAKGFSREIVGIITAVVALLLGAWFYGTAGGWLEPYVSSRRIANFCGFLIVFVAVLVLGSLAGNALGKLLKVTGLSFFDRLLGAGFGALRGVLLAVALVMALMAFAPAGKPPEAVVHSRCAPYVVDAARVAAAMAPHELKDGFRKSYAQVKTLWEEALRKGIRDLPDGEKARHERDI